MKFDFELLNKLKSLAAGMESDREDYRPTWRDLADYILPYRYTWLLSDTERRKKMSRNPNILDGTGTKAARVQASGMHNGITSPSRPWFKLRLKRDPNTANIIVRRWLDEVETRIMQAMADTNFYSAMAVMYLDLSIFGTSGVLIYEDYNSIFRCYNMSLGEYSLANSASGLVNTFTRKFKYTAAQCYERFGDNASEAIRTAAKAGGANSLQQYTVNHIVLPNNGKFKNVPQEVFQSAEVYWLDSQADEQVLSVRGYNELPGIFPRWEVAGNDAYGNSPGMDALGDIIQLQHEQKRKAQSLDFMNRPPLAADIQLQYRPTALLPGGVTYVAGLNNIGVKPLYQVQPPVQDMTLDIREVQGRIKEIFNNDLFMMISQLETVRTATEIDARREEKLVQLGPVLERFENEALDPAIARIYSIMSRAQLIPPPPPGLENEELEIKYVSILSAAQSAVGVAPVERWVQFTGNIAAMYPSAINVPNWSQILRDYGRDIGVKAAHINTEEEEAAKTQAQEEYLKSREAANQGQALTAAAKNLSETQVGGGANALQQLLS